MKAKHIVIRTFNFVEMYKFIVDSHAKDLQDAIKHNLRHAQRHDMQIGIAHMPYENLRDYIRKTLIRCSENQTVHWIGNRNKVIEIVPARYTENKPYTHTNER